MLCFERSLKLLIDLLKARRTQVTAFVLKKYSRRSGGLNIAAQFKTRMGGGKTGRGKKIPRDETATSSTRSVQTPFGVQNDGVLGVDGRCGGAGGDGGMAHLQMADSQGTNSQAKGQPTNSKGDDDERVHSHTLASTSPRCGFHWLHKELDERLAAWSLEEGEDLDDHHCQDKCMSIPSSDLKHIIGRGGRTLHKLESFVGVFASVVDTKTGPEICFVGCPRACLLAEFIVEMIMGGHYSIMESLARNGF